MSMYFEYKKQIQDIMEAFKDQMDEPDVKGPELLQLIEENKDEFAGVVLVHMMDVYGEEIF